MKVKAIMKPVTKLTYATREDSIDKILNQLTDKKLMSMPVLDNGKLVGVISKQHIYEKFFGCSNMTRQEYLNQKIDRIIETVDEINLPLISENTVIEDAAALFIESKFRFIPVVAKDGTLLGIVTQQSIFKEYQRIYGTGYDKMTILTYDIKGTLAKISDTIAKLDGNIKNIYVSDTNTMGVQEFFIRIDSNDFDGIVKNLERKGFDVRIPDKI